MMSFKNQVWRTYIVDFFNLLLPWIVNILILLIWLSASFILFYLFLNMINPKKANSLIIVLKNNLFKMDFLISIWQKAVSIYMSVEQWLIKDFRGFFRFIFKNLFKILCYLFIIIIAITLTLSIINYASHPEIIERLIVYLVIFLVFSYILSLIIIIFKMFGYILTDTYKSINKLETFLNQSNKREVMQLSIKIISYTIIILISPVLIFTFIYGIVNFILQDLPLDYLIHKENLQFALNIAFPNLISDSFITHSTIYQNINISYIEDEDIDTTHISWLNYITVAQHIVQKLVDVFVIGYIASSIIQIFNKSERKEDNHD